MNPFSCVETGPDSQTFVLNLCHKAMFSVPNAANVRFACVEGAVWITVDKNPNDIVLEAGELFVTPECRRVIVYALKNSMITLAKLSPNKAQLTKHMQTALELRMEPI